MTLVTNCVEPVYADSGHPRDDILASSHRPAGALFAGAGTFLVRSRGKWREFRCGRTAADRSLRVIVAGAGGAAHLPGMLAAVTTLPVIGVPVPFAQFDGLDWLLSIVKMLAGVRVATVAVGHSDARVRPGTDVYLDALTQTRPTLNDADIAALTQDIERLLRS